MRKAKIISALFEAYKNNPRIIILNCDDSLFGFSEFFEYDKKRIFNVGIAEQATIGIAAAMSTTELVPIVFSKLNFIILRAYEQIKYDVNEHNFPVKIIGIGADNFNKSLGRTHCIDQDDIQLVSLLKNIRLFNPTDESYSSDFSDFINCKAPSILRCQ